MTNFELTVKCINDKFNEMNPSSGVPCFRVGEKSRNEHRSPGSVVFVSPGGVFSNDHPGTGYRVSDDGDSSFETLPFHRTNEFECHIWECNAQRAEDLFIAIILAMYREIGIENFQLSTYDEPTEVVATSGSVINGHSYRFDGVIHTMIPKNPMALALINETPTTGEINEQE